MDLNDYHVSGSVEIRAYGFFPLDPINQFHHHPDVITQSLRRNHPLPYPYTWYVSGDQAVVVNENDLFAFEVLQLSSPPSSSNINPRYDSETVDGVMILNDHNNNMGTDHETNGQIAPVELPEITDEHVAMLDEFIMYESFERAANFAASSGLSRRFISKNLRVMRYNKKGDDHEDDGEMCVVCQAEFEKNEKVGVLQCKHMYHPKCIQEWLIRQNVCPLCKAQGLKV